MSTHTEIFEHTDGDEDRIRVLHIEEGLSLLDRRLLIDTREVDGGWVQVVLGRDDALRLAKAITDALEPGLSYEGLVDSPRYMEVVDKDGNTWTNTSPDGWSCANYWRDLGTAELVGMFGPLTAVQA